MDESTTGMMELRAVRNGKEWRAVKEIRTRVFVEEQECPPELEWDEHETSSRHMIGLVDGEPMATARWRTVYYEDRPIAKLERFAVLPAYRGKGLGRQLVAEVIEDTRLAGLNDCLIHAQSHLEDFYRSFGFEAVGEPFEEAGIPHITMVRWGG